MIQNAKRSCSVRHARMSDHVKQKASIACSVHHTRIKLGRNTQLIFLSRFRCSYVTMGCATSVTMMASAVGTNGADISTEVITPQQKKIVKRTWRYLANDMTGHGKKVFLKIFEMNPHVKDLFPCRDVTGEALLRDSNFKGHAARFMQAVGAAVDNIDDLGSSLSPLLIGLGRQHTTFSGLQPEYFNAFTEAMLFVWQQELKDKFTEDVRGAWKTVFDFLMSRLKEGYHLETVENPQIECLKH